MTSPDNTVTILMVIGGAALATYSLRLCGLLIGERLPRHGRFRRFMDTLPGTILIALVAPGVMAAGIWGLVATGITALCVLKTRNLFVSMVAGVVVIALQRHFFP